MYLVHDLGRGGPYLIESRLQPRDIGLPYSPAGSIMFVVKAVAGLGSMRRIDELLNLDVGRGRVSYRIMPSLKMSPAQGQC